ncbi:MAG: amidohydrolase [Bryobacterales bacterium]|nr:amidohydrolase [Bryobacterales bacterium]
MKHPSLLRGGLLLLGAASWAWAQLPQAERARVLKQMDDTAPHYGQLSRQIWEFAEVGYKETKSSALLRDELRKHGFRVEENVGNIPTAFTATWGSGAPVIALLGEYDALPELSQEDVPERKPRVAGAPGHGCGHNLFGSAVAMAAITVKDYLEQRKLPGTIRFYGTPAEEGGGGKVYMARAGAFRDADVALTWHPGSENHAGLGSSLANINAKFKFRGVASHAASAPWNGRSALDAVLLMNHALELMREHVPTETRIHYIITKGGAAPNIVPENAETYVYARHPKMTVLDGVWARVVKCAEAAALATETKMEMEIVNSVWDVLPNDALAALLDKNLRAAGGVKYTPEERAFAEKLRGTMELAGAPPLGHEETVVPPGAMRGLGGSTDVGDVSWQLPTAQFTAATWAPGTSAHSWQSTAFSGMSIGRKGMLVAAKTLALTVLDLLHDPQQVKLAREAFEKRRAGVEYRSRVPASQGAPLTYRDTK